MRRAYDAIAEIHQFGTSGYQWVLDADIEAAFNLEAVPVTRYRYRGSMIPSPWVLNHA